MRSALASELTVLATELLRIARADRRTRDYTFNTLRRALAEVAACMPVYRTYIVDTPSEQDRALRRLGGRARRAGAASAADTSIFDFVRQSLLARRRRRRAARRCSERVRALRDALPAVHRAGRRQGRRGHRVLPLQPARLAERGRRRPGAVRHHACAPSTAPSADRAARWPHTMLATSTHDNKRSADVRCRIDVLSEMPAAWRLLLRRWSRMNRTHRAHASAATAPAPSRADEYLLYQTLLGTLPADGLDDDAALGAVPRAHRGLHAEGGARGQDAHRLDQPRRGLRGRAVPASSPACSAGVAPNLFLDDLTRAGAPAGLVRRAQQPERDAAQVHLARRARPLPGPRGDRT